MFTKTLSKVIQEIEVLSEKEQNYFANLLNEEIKWSKLLNNSQNLLSELATEALLEHKNKLTKFIK
jgi:hypothetical protein